MSAPDPSPGEVRHRLEAVRENVRRVNALLVDPLSLAGALAELDETTAVYALLDGEGAADRDGAGR